MTAKTTAKDNDTFAKDMADLAKALTITGKDGPEPPLALWLARCQASYNAAEMADQQPPMLTCEGVQALYRLAEAGQKPPAGAPLSYALAAHLFTCSNCLRQAQARSDQAKAAQEAFKFITGGGGSGLPDEEEAKEMFASRKPAAPVAAAPATPTKPVAAAATHK